MRTLTDIRSFNYPLVLSVISKLFLLLESFLLLRLMLKFLGANPGVLVVKLIYQYTGIVVSPFNFIFRNVYLRGHLIEISVITAMIGYALAIFLFFQLIRLFSRDITING